MKNVERYHVYPYASDCCPKVQPHRMRKYFVDDVRYATKSNKKFNMLEQMEYRLEIALNM